MNDHPITTEMRIPSPADDAELTATGNGRFKVTLEGRVVGEVVSFEEQMAVNVRSRMFPRGAGLYWGYRIGGSGIRGKFMNRKAALEALIKQANSSRDQR